MEMEMFACIVSVNHIINSKTKYLSYFYLYHYEVMPKLPQKPDFYLLVGYTMFSHLSAPI